jgi:Uma2 family endonuclease
MSQERLETIMALSAEYPQWMSVEDYLLLDNMSKTVKYEYIDGTLRMLAGGSPDHSIIAGNLITLLNNALRKTPCIVYTSDVYLQLSASQYVHSDVTVSCDERDKEQKNIIQYPRLLVEVLSPSTEAIDKGDKLDAYLEYPTLQEYILVGSKKKTIEVYHRDNDIWTSRIYKSGSTIHLKSIELQLSLEDVYEKTSLA